MNKFLLQSLAMICVIFSMTSSVYAQAQASSAGVRIFGYGIHYGGNIVYNYKVVNSGTKTVRSFVIGNEFDSEENDSFPQLLRLPLGWSYGRTGEIGTEIVLAPGSISQPQGWQSTVYGKQDSGMYYLEWNSYSGDESIDIYPGQTLAGFSVTVPLVDKKLLLPRVTGQPVYTGPDENYIKGSFRANIVDANNKSEKVWGAIEPIDTTAPTLTITLSPNKLWPANGKLVPITATVSARDDYDPQPEIKLVSVTLNETLDKEDAKRGIDDRHFMLRAKREGKNKAGRIYTVTYSATDGSGNKSIASATVTVPHDDREHEGRDKEKNERGEKDKGRNEARK
jgi:hypothetical protein